MSLQSWTATWATMSCGSSGTRREQQSGDQTDHEWATAAVTSAGDASSPASPMVTQNTPGPYAPMSCGESPAPVETVDVVWHDVPPGRPMPTVSVRPSGRSGPLIPVSVTATFPYCAIEKE